MRNRTDFYGLISIIIFLLSVGPVLIPAHASSGEEDARFHAREYMSETEALEYQTEPNTRVERDTIVLSSEQVKTLRERQRVKVYTNTYTVYKLFREGDDEPYRFAVPLQETGQHEFMDLMYGVNRDGTINRIDLMVYREPYGSEIESRRFMEQYEGRSLRDSEFRLNLDVVHIAGATISARAVNSGTRRVLEILRMKDLTNVDSSS